MTADELRGLLYTWIQGRTALDKALLAALEQAPVPPPAPVSKPGVLLPAYFAPSSPQWNLVLAAAKKLDIVAVINNGNPGGPGASRSPAYADLIARCAAVGVKVIGYVATGYGARASALVLSDIASWYSFYPDLGGIFFDQQAPGAAFIPAYTIYTTDVHARGGYVASNAGSSCVEGYRSIAKIDSLVLWESAASKGTPTIPTWASAAPDLSIAGLVHGASTAQISTLVPEMRRRGFGRVFVTGDVMPNPWNDLNHLTGWDDFVAAEG